MAKHAGDVKEMMDNNITDNNIKNVRDIIPAIYKSWNLIYGDFAAFLEGKSDMIILERNVENPKKAAPVDTTRSVQTGNAASNAVYNTASALTANHSITHAQNSATTAVDTKSTIETNQLRPVQIILQKIEPDIYDSSFKFVPSKTSASIGFYICLGTGDELKKEEENQDDPIPYPISHWITYQAMEPLNSFERGVLEYCRLYENPGEARKKFDEALKKIDTACKKNGLKHKIIGTFKCGQHAPYVYRICVDFKIV